MSEEKEVKEKAKETKEIKEEKKPKVDKKTEELQKLQDEHLRILAEYDNFRKRTAKEKAEIWSDATASAAKNLIDVSDNFERALAIECKDPDFKKGIEMIHTSLLAAFEKMQITSFGEVGDTFDPNIHMAVMHVDDETKGEGEITDVFQKGYKINEKLIRPATVKVAN